MTAPAGRVRYLEGPDAREFYVIRPVVTQSLWV